MAENGLQEPNEQIVSFNKFASCEGVEISDDNIFVMQTILLCDNPITIFTIQFLEGAEKDINFEKWCDLLEDGSNRSSIREQEG